MKKEIKVSAESLQSFKHDAGVQGITQREIATPTQRMIAPIDEKNVTSDWIEQIFDCLNCTHTETKRTHKYCGFVLDELVMCSYVFGTNTLTWKIFAEGERVQDAETAKSTLLHTLKEIDKENEGLICEYDVQGNTIYQSFYWGEE